MTDAPRNAAHKGSPRLDDAQLAAYVDGELDDDAARALEAQLFGDPEARRRLAELRETSALLRQAFAPTLHEPVPERFTALLEVKPEDAKRENVLAFPAARRRRWVAPSLVAASVLIAAVGIGVNTIGVGSFGDFADRSLQRLVSQSGDNWLDDATGAYTVHSGYLAEEKPLMDIDGEQAEAVGNFFGQRFLKKDLHVPDLSQRGFALKGGRLLVVNGKPAAQILYSTDKGEPLALMITSRPGDDRAQRFVRRDDVNVLHWKSGGYLYAVIGRLDRGQLQEIANEIGPKLAGA
jgi:anti-sigma factor RsiW